MPAEQKLREFFREKNAGADSAVDWQQKKADWVRAVDNLYETIREYLAAPIADGTVTVSFEDRELTEELIGSYTVRALVLRVAGEKVTFAPKGVNVVGATGRIDLKGDMGDTTIVRQPDDRWGVVATRTPTLKIVPLSEESLLAALKSVMRP